MSAPLLLHVFPSFTVGGSQMRFAALANRFGRRFRHIVAAIDGCTDCRDRLNEDLDLTFASLDLRKRDTFGNVSRFRDYLHSVRPWRLVTHNWGSMDCAMANWPKLASHIHIEDGFGPEEATRQLWRRILVRRTVLSHSTVVLPSQKLYRLATDVWRLPRGRLRYVPNGIDCARFNASTFPPLRPSGCGPIIGTVAALRREKNLVRLLDAFGLLRRSMQCRLLIVGDGPERKALEDYARAIGVAASVTFAGQLRDTERAYAALTVFALSSDTEQMPTAVLEGMAAALPVVSTDVGDVRDMVSEPNRPFVTRCTAEALASSLRELLAAPERMKAIGEANRTRVGMVYDQSVMFAKYEALFAGTAEAVEPQVLAEGAWA